MRTVLVTIVGPSQVHGRGGSVRDGPQARLDLSLPADVPIGELLPTLARLFTVAPPGPEARHWGPDGRWALETADGSSLDAAASLGANGILNGALLQLRRPPPRPEPVPPPTEPRAEPAAPAPIDWGEPVAPAALPASRNANRWLDTVAALAPAGTVPAAPPASARVPAAPVDEDLEPVVPIGTRRRPLGGAGTDTGADTGTGAVAASGRATPACAAPVPADPWAPPQGRGSNGNGVHHRTGASNGVPETVPTSWDRRAWDAPERPWQGTWDGRETSWGHDEPAYPSAVDGPAANGNGVANGDGVGNGNGAAGPGPLTRARKAWRSADYPRHLDAGIVAPRLRRGVTIAIVSPKPGSGRTTVGWLLGATLVELRPDQVRVVEAARDAGTVALGGVVLVDGVAGLDGSSARTAIGLADQLVVVTDTDPATGSLAVEAALPLLEAGRSVTIVVNQRPMRGRRLDVHRLHQMLPLAGGPVLLPHEPAAAAALHDGRLALPDAPAGWRRAGRELAYILTADWLARGCAR